MLEQLPEQIGRYHIDKQIGQGAMGRVFLGRDPELDRPVAIKVIRDPGLARKEAASFSERFKNEARAAAKLNHPSIVQIFDVGEEEFIGPFLVFEFVSGQTLQDRLAELGALSVQDTLRIAREMGAAIDFAHVHGIIHRDIKPANILLPENGPAKLADFGVARLPDAMLTREGQFLGTPCYSAPETLSEGKYGPASDLFSFASVVYEVLTGVRAFKGLDAISVAQAVIESNPEKVSTYNTHFSAEVDSVFTKAFSKNPKQRFTLATDFVANLAHALGDGGTTSASLSSPLYSESKTKTHLFRWGLLGVSGASILLSSWWVQTYPQRFTEIKDQFLFSQNVAPVFSNTGGEDGNFSVEIVTIDNAEGQKNKEITAKMVPMATDVPKGGHESLTVGSVGGAMESSMLLNEAPHETSEMTLREKEEKAKDAYFSAKNFFKQGKNLQAQEAIENAFRFDPENPEIQSLKKEILAAALKNKILLQKPPTIAAEPKAPADLSTPEKSKPAGSNENPGTGGRGDF